MLDDICTVIESNINTEIHVCPTCGNETEEVDYDEPKEDEWQ
jgi:hypothetical protein